MKSITIYEGKVVNDININKIEAVIKGDLEIKIVCPKYNYYENFKTVEEQDERHKEIIAFLKKDGEFV